MTLVSRLGFWWGKGSYQGGIEFSEAGSVCFYLDGSEARDVVCCCWSLAELFLQNAMMSFNIVVIGGVFIYYEEFVCDDLVRWDACISDGDYGWSWNC